MSMKQSYEVRTHPCLGDFRVYVINTNGNTNDVLTPLEALALAKKLRYHAECAQEKTRKLKKKWTS